MGFRELWVSQAYVRTPRRGRRSREQMACQAPQIPKILMSVLCRYIPTTLIGNLFRNTVPKNGENGGCHKKIPQKILGIFRTGDDAWRRPGRLCRLDTPGKARAPAPRRLDVGLPHPFWLVPAEERFFFDPRWRARAGTTSWSRKSTQRQVSSSAAHDLCSPTARLCPSAPLP